MSKSQEDALRFVQENADAFVPPDVARAQELMEFVRANSAAFPTHQQEKEQPGFVEKYGGGLLQLLADAYSPGVQSPEELARMAVFGAGAVDAAILSPVEGLAGAASEAAEWFNVMPGLDKLPMIKFGEEGAENVSAFRAIEDFAHRTREGLLVDIEVDALAAGLNPGEIAGQRGLGHFVGFTAPMTASYKVASTLFNVPKMGALRFPFLAHLPEDFVAGAVFGALFQPADGALERVKHTLSESALFGIGRIVFNGIMFPTVGARSRRFHLMKESGKIDDMMLRLREGRPIVLTEEEGQIVGQLLSEEEFVINSVGAQIYIQKGNAEAALMQGIIDSAHAGESAGVVRGLGLSFEEVMTAVGKWEAEASGLKFTVVKNKKTGDYDVVFGTQGLSNQQKKQLANEGRFQGLWLEKGGAQYEYVSPAGNRKGKPNPDGTPGDDIPYINVRTSDGKVTQIADVGVTDLFTYHETIKPNDVLNRLFEDFAKMMDDEINMFTVAGVTTEADLIRGIRNGTIVLDSSQRRSLDVTGAIVHPEEMGLPLVGEHGISGIKFSRVAEDGTIRTGRLQRLGGYRENGPWGFIENPAELSGRPSNPISVGSTLDEAVEQMQAAEWRPGEIAFTTPNAEQTMAAIVKEGYAGGGNLPNRMPYITFDDAFAGWAKSKGLPTDAPDFPAMKSYFAETYRNRMWRSVDKEDRAIFDAIRNEHIDLINKGEIPLKAQAHNKGIHYEPQEDGTILLRDIRSGATITAQSEGAAKEILKFMQRSDSDMVETLLPFEGIGMSGMTGGWEHPGNYLYFGGEVDAASYMGTAEVPALLKARNVRDIFQYVENKTGVPLFTQVFDQLDRNLSTMRRRLEPFAKRIDKVWSGMPQRGKGSRYELAEWWTELDGTDMTMAEALKFLKVKGATGQQQRAYKESRDIFDLFFEMQGIEKGRYINHYYSRVRPWVEQKGGIAPDMNEIFGKGNIPPEFQFWAEMNRTGDLAQIEMDPLVVMHRYARSLFFKQEVAESYHMARNLVKRKTTPRIKDLPESIRNEVLKSHPRAKAEDPVLPQEVIDVIGEYLNIIRGTPRESVNGLRNFTTRFFKHMGIKADPKTLENFIDIHLSNMYGAAMALRPSLTARNATQTVWTLYTRLGGRWGSHSLEKAMSVAGYEEALAASAIRSSTAGVPQGDAIWGQFLDEGVMEGSNVVNRAFAGAWRKGMRLGHATSKVGRAGLIPYSATDDMNRAWSYHWQKMHSEEWLGRFESGKIDWAKFSEEGLPFFDKATKDQFQRLYNSQGKEASLRWIGKIAADEAQWIYGVGAQPAFLQSPVGRFVGMFGTWPMWAAELYFNRAWNGTGRQRAALAMRTVALVGAFANMTMQSGYDMWSYIAPTSMFGWSGGPVVDHAITMRDIIEAPLDQKGKSLGRLARDVGRLSFPGQIFLSDFGRALDAQNPAEGFMKMMLGRPVDDYNFSLEVLYDPNNLENYYMYPQDQAPPVRPGLSPGGTSQTKPQPGSIPGDVTYGPPVPANTPAPSRPIGSAANVPPYPVPSSFLDTALRSNRYDLDQTYNSIASGPAGSVGEEAKRQLTWARELDSEAFTSWSRLNQGSPDTLGDRRKHLEGMLAESKLSTPWTNN